MDDLKNIQKTDYEIIHSVLNGNKEEYALIINKYQIYVANIISKLIPNIEDIKDLTQEIFTKVYFCLPKYSIKYEFKSWLYKLTINYVLDFIRRENSKYKLKLIFEDECQYELKCEKDDLCEKKEFEEKAKRLYECINKLKTKYKEVIILKYIEGLSIKQIAEILNTNCNNIKVRLHRAIKIIKKIF